jgi:hypothetical protein
VRKIIWMIFDPPQPFLAALAGLQAEDTWHATREGLFHMWTEGVDNDAVVEFVHSVMGAHESPMWARSGREIFAAYAEHGNPLKAFSSLPNPPRVLHLYAQPPSSEYLQAQRAFADNNSWFSVERLDEAKSHFPYFEVPRRIAQEIQAFAHSH